MTGRSCFVINMLLMSLIFFGPNLAWALLFGRVFLGLLLLLKPFINGFLGMGEMLLSGMTFGLEIVPLRPCSGISLRSANSKMPHLPKCGTGSVYTSHLEDVWT